MAEKVNTLNCATSDAVAGKRSPLKYPVIGAIDFGTTNSGCGFIYTDDPDRVTTRKRLPTSVLLQRGTLEVRAFGQEAIEALYILSDEESDEVHLFHHFKMNLYTAKTLSRDTVLADHVGRKVKAMNVFSVVLRYLVDKTYADIQISKIHESSRMDLTDIGWVLTIPAIWSDSARQFMREAAKNAGISSERLRLVLEPEAASLFCRSAKLVAGENGMIKTMQPGHKYIIADIGGGTVDICVHEILDGQRLHELYRATGDYAGGTKVNEEFNQFLDDLFGSDVMNKFKHEYADEYHKFIETFEKEKKGFWQSAEREKVVLKFSRILEKLIGKQSQKGGLKSAAECIQQNERYRNEVSLEKSQLKIDNCVFKKFFDPSIQNLVDKIREILNACSKDNISTLMLVGGYSESCYLQEKIRSEFNQLAIAVPEDASCAVLKGALKMGLEPLNTIARRSRFSYGFSVMRKFDKAVHPARLKHFRDGKPFCKNVFDRLIERNKLLKYGDTFINETSNKLKLAASWSMELTTQDPALAVFTGGPSILHQRRTL